MATLGPFLKAWLAARKGDYKPASLIAWGQVIDALTDFFGADRSLADVTPAKAEAFRQSMLEAGLRRDDDSQAVATRPHVFCPCQAARFGGREPV